MDIRLDNILDFFLFFPFLPLSWAIRASQIKCVVDECVDGVPQIARENELHLSMINLHPLSRLVGPEQKEISVSGSKQTEKETTEFQKPTNVITVMQR